MDVRLASSQVVFSVPIIYQGVLQAALVMSVYGLALAYPVHVGDNHAIHADALTMAFATLGLIQLFHAYNVKSVYQSILTVGPFKSKTFNWSILVSFILLMATIVVEPLEGIFHVTKLDLSQWGNCYGWKLLNDYHCRNR